ncbi:GTP pyrophosphokinase [Corynebacterium uberis]|uniref:GTP pyrophosphokinase n=1 Tax=Corynebacterium TaxID=1716 RepID=UPI001D0BB9B1|nr:MULTISPECIES: GTP pyrophosphokinase family protein [Corynebacterium]MCZ9308352.1 GTP pyrophosphokinase family protein [Corynebacterium sp. c6VSa_13]UDL74024.1 GTP pyrophosphokinase family protein [Corynebacterium uberis]UDL75092.1 GTP pyrophosphokinase family protein [Corynebacterium uberis]UDL77305.1 GTP pyrophosphokinase family protein [Corynebacterium uberis]UDL79589.1 GTP pyrophosphokinase family protein [Corynebacterium uberis]
MNDNPVAQLGNDYHRWITTHPHASADFVAAIEELLSDAGVTYDRIVARVKTWPSLKAKAYKRDATGSPVYPDPWQNIHDLVGVRVTTYHSTEIPVAIAVLRQSFSVVRSVDKTAETRIAGNFGYGSHHLVLRIEPNTEGLEDYAGFVFEVQVRTVLQHAWAEFEHDIRYKSGATQLDPRVDRAFTLAAGLIELADQQFDQIATLQGSQQDTKEDVELSAEILPGVLSMLVGTRFPRSRSDHYRWLSELLARNGITHVGQLRELLNEEDISAVSSAMAYRYQPGQVRIIDDLLLARFGRDHIARTGDTGNRSEQRPRRLERRLAALRAAGVSPRPSV